MKALIQPHEESVEPHRMNRRKAIRARCIDCSGSILSEVRNCRVTKCTLHSYRSGEGQQDPGQRDKAIRAYCLDCMCGQMKEVRLCPSKDCPLYRFRNTKTKDETGAALPEIPHLRARSGAKNENA